MNEPALRISLQAPYANESANEDACPFPDLPRMATVANPCVYGLRAGDGTRQFLEALRVQLAVARTGESTQPRSLLAEDEATRRILGEILGSGEVVIHCRRGNDRLAAEESVFPGVWRERLWQQDVLVRDDIVVGPLPPRVLAWAAAPAGRRGFEMPEPLPEGLMNAPSVLFEILSKARDFQPDSCDIINLTLFPLPPEDAAFLEKELGFGGLHLVARGYGECRVRLTAVPRVWWVQYYNSTNQPILNTLEITEFPQVALAAPEDLDDSGLRLRDTLETLT
jgi:hydrogenase-1 operon protein HyaF